MLGPSTKIILDSFYLLISFIWEIFQWDVAFWCCRKRDSLFAFAWALKIQDKTGKRTALSNKELESSTPRKRLTEVVKSNERQLLSEAKSK